MELAFLILFGISAIGNVIQGFQSADLNNQLLIKDKEHTEYVLKVQEQKTKEVEQLLQKTQKELVSSNEAYVEAIEQQAKEKYEQEVQLEKAKEVIDEIKEECKDEEVDFSNIAI